MNKYLILILLAGMSQAAFADSFWNHNGSIMRLVANGNERQFIYEVPSKKMYNTGVRPGSVLFNGYKNGNKYFGTSTVFSKNCHYDLAYKVSGNVYEGPKVVLYGKRTEYDTSNNKCVPTGRVISDKLVFTYMYTE